MAGCTCKNDANPHVAKTALLSSTRGGVPQYILVDTGEFFADIRNPKALWSGSSVHAMCEKMKVLKLQDLTWLDFPTTRYRIPDNPSKAAIIEEIKGHKIRINLLFYAFNEVS